LSAIDEGVLAIAGPVSRFIALRRLEWRALTQIGTPKSLILSDQDAENEE